MAKISILDFSDKVKVRSDDTIFHHIFHQIFPSDSLSTKIVQCDPQVDWKSEERPIFNRLCGENRDITITFSHTTKILNRFYQSKIDCKIVSCDLLNNILQSIYLSNSIGNLKENRIVWPHLKAGYSTNY